MDEVEEKDRVDVPDPEEVIEGVRDEVGVFVSEIEGVGVRVSDLDFVVVGVNVGVDEMLLVVDGDGFLDAVREGV